MEVEVHVADVVRDLARDRARQGVVAGRLRRVRVCGAAAAPPGAPFGGLGGGGEGGSCQWADGRSSAAAHVPMAQTDTIFGCGCAPGVGVVLEEGGGGGWVGSRPHPDLRDHGRRPSLRVTTGPAGARLSGLKACRTDDRPRTPRWHTREGDAAKRGGGGLQAQSLWIKAGKHWKGGRGGGGASGTQKAYQKGPDQIFPTVNFVVSHDGPFGLGGGGAPMGYGHNTSLDTGPGTTSVVRITEERSLTQGFP